MYMVLHLVLVGHGIRYNGIKFEFWSNMFKRKAKKSKGDLKISIRIKMGL